MQRLISTALLVMFLAVLPRAFAQGQGTAMLFLPQPESPAVLVETYHGNKDLFKSAKLQNRSSEPIVGYRIGWVAVYLDSTREILLCIFSMMRLTGSWHTSAKANSAGQGGSQRIATAESFGDLISDACNNFAYSILACFRIGISGSASFQMAKKTSYALRLSSLSPCRA
jgi:hypothetical protein